MLFSKQLNSSILAVPSEWSTRRTSALLDNGLLALGVGSGLVAYTSLGAGILERIESLILAELALLDYDCVAIPHIMSDADLNSGQDVGVQFLSKIMHLDKAMPGHHLITSPEMMFGRWASTFEISHRTLPIRLCYRTSIFRRMRETRSFLTCREFRVVGALSFLPHQSDAADVREELARVTAAFRRAGEALAAPLIEMRGNTESELGYVCSEGDVRASINGCERTALSISVGYDYARNLAFPMPYRDVDNGQRTPQVMTVALCANRLMYACFDSARDDLGFALAATVRPFDVVVVPRSRRDVEQAQLLATRARNLGLRVGHDERVNRTVGARTAFSAYIGAPASVLVHGDLVVVTARGAQHDFGKAMNTRDDKWIDRVIQLG